MRVVFPQRKEAVLYVGFRRSGQPFYFSKYRRGLFEVDLQFGVQIFQIQAGIHGFVYTDLSLRISG